MRPLAISIFGSTVVAAAAYVVPHLLAMQLNRRIIAENDKVREFLTETSASGVVAKGDPNSSLFGSYL